MNDNQDYANQLLILLNEVKDKISREDVRNIAEYAENHEWGLAYEILCDQLYEYNVAISNTFYEKISSFGKAIMILPSIWLPLKELIR